MYFFGKKSSLSLPPSLSLSLSPSPSPSLSLPLPPSPSLPLSLSPSPPPSPSPSPSPSLSLSLPLSHSQHDPSTSNCSPGSNGGGNYIMFPRATNGQRGNNNRFSPCSIDSIRDALESSKSDCFCEDSVSYSLAPSLPPSLPPHTLSF